MKFTKILSLLFLMVCLVMGGQAACICTADYRPVCGTNGVTYSNLCHLSCEGSQFKHDGAC